MPGGRPHRRDLQPPHRLADGFGLELDPATREAAETSDRSGGATGRRRRRPFQAWLEPGWVSVVDSEGRTIGSLTRTETESVYRARR